MFTSTTAVAMASLISAAFASPFELETRQSGSCSSLHIIAAGGCHLPCNQDGLGLLSTTVAKISGEIPNSDLALVPYDGSEKQAAVSTPLLNQMVAQYTQQCPNTPIVLVGYSLGGIVITNSVCGGIPYTKNLIASVTYGEETFAYPRSYDRGTCMANAPKYARTQACTTFAPVMQSYCDALDPNCCSTGNQDDNSAHFQYANKYDNAVAAYVLSQYNAYQAAYGTVGPKFSAMPFYSNSSATAVGGGAGAQNTKTIITKTVTGTTTIPLFEATGLTTPVNPTGTYVPLSAVVESQVGNAKVVAAGTGSGVAVATVLVQSTVTIPGQSAQVTQGGAGAAMGTMSPSSFVTGTGSMGAGSFNGASSLAISGSLAAIAALAMGLLL